jgi:hypothetical protein
MYIAKYPILLFLGILLHCQSIYTRSIWRKSTRQRPCISVFWQSKPKKKYTLCNDGMNATMFIPFRSAQINKHLVTNHKTITSRQNSLKTIDVADIDAILNNLVRALKKGKIDLTDFTVLKWRDYNRRRQSGNLILKFKKYPLVIKLFMENPRGFVHPFSKGIEPTFMFSMNGGITRHLSGFTRIGCRQKIIDTLANIPKWKDRIVIPRKWYWLPKNEPSITVIGENFGTPKALKMTIPSVYGIVCDAIDVGRPFSLLNAQDKKIGLELFDILENQIDPNIPNLLYEKDTNNIALIDTEDFPMLVGLNKKHKPQSYFGWYTKAGCEFFRRCYGLSKKKRSEWQQKALQNYLSYE